MKKIIIAFSLCFMLFACDSEGNVDKDKYLKVYKEILVVRESISDSIAANKEVQLILDKYKYTTKSFADETMKLMSQDKDLFNIIDSLRKEFREKY